VLSLDRVRGRDGLAFAAVPTASGAPAIKTLVDPWVDAPRAFAPPRSE
jgi:hypothetical protein